MNISKNIRSLCILALWAALNSCGKSIAEHTVPHPGSPLPTMSSTISNQQVSCFAEDALGHIWIGTFRGLNKFYSGEYEQYFFQNDSTGLPDSRIGSMYRDSRGTLWIGTANGVCTLDSSEKFHRVGWTGLGKYCVQIFENGSGEIFAHNNFQVFRYDGDSDAFLILPLESQQNSVWKCHIDSSDRLWVVTKNSIGAFDTESGRQLYRLELNSNASTPVSCLQDGRFLWFYDSGLRLFDTKSMKALELPAAMGKDKRLLASRVTAIHQHGNEQMIFSTATNGAFLFDMARERLMHQSEDDFPLNMPEREIKCMFSDSSGNLWTGTNDQAYTVSYREKNPFNNNTALCGAFEGKSVLGTVCDEKALWISTSADGLYSYSLPDGKISRHNFHPLRLMMDRKGCLWMYEKDGDLICAKPEGNVLKVISRYNCPSLMNLACSTDDAIWAGSGSHLIFRLVPGESGLVPMDVFEEGEFTFSPGLMPLPGGKMLVAARKRPLRIASPDGTSEQAIVDCEDWNKCVRHSIFVPTILYKDTRGSIWIGTIGNGLLRYNDSNGKMTRMEMLSCDDIVSIAEDNFGYLWVGTLHGLNKIDISTGKVACFYDFNGLGGNQFNERACCVLPDGSLVFGGTHGISLMDPQFVPHKHRVPLCFEQLRVHNRIAQDLSYKPEVNLDYVQRSFSISFAAMDYSEYSRVQYSYMLEGIDKYWIDSRNHNEASYANIPAGRYTFRVRMTSNDSSIAESEEAISIRIKHAPWDSWWAWTIYILVFLVILSVFNFTKRREKRQKAAIIAAEEEKRHEKEITKMVKRFFANISHEFRTPLTMLSGPMAQLDADPDLSEENRKLVHIMQRSTNRMLQLINQIMDLGKIDNQALPLEVSRTDVISVLSRTLEVFEAYASNKGISLRSYGVEGHLEMLLDTDKFEKIFNNLMSNALKFTKKNGTICVSFDMVDSEGMRKMFDLKDLHSDWHYVVVSVSDTGPIIPEDQLPMVFERFYQVKSSTKVYGTGIGLYYARILAEIHHGAIKVENLEGGDGVMFTFALPCDDGAYSEEDRLKVEEIKPLPLPEQPIPSIPDSEESEADMNKLLVVDDDVEVVHYMKALLGRHYKVVCAYEAEEALRRIENEAPDMVISDVMLPGITGFELCRRIKENAQLCHIPVILLTAKTSLSDKVEGLDTGADAYVTKPFEPAYLLALLKSLMKNRERVRLLLGEITTTSEVEKEDSLAPQDKEFMGRLYDLMETELENSEFDITNATDKLHISRTKLFYKVKALTGTSPSIFFKTYKLNRAAELLKEGRYTISEVADMTGFSTLSHFSKSFKKHFGASPSDWTGK